MKTTTSTTAERFTSFDRKGRPVRMSVPGATLADLARQVAIAAGAECPDCGSTAEHEDNGQAGRWLEFRCVNCDHRWGPGAEV